MNFDDIINRDYIIEKAKNINTVVFDVDGVLFTGRVFVDRQGESLKERSLIDGQGISLLRAAGFQIGFVTGENSQHNFLEPIIIKMNNLPSCRDGRWKPVSFGLGKQGQQKVDWVEDWLGVECNWLTIACMGDDLSDWHLLKKAHLAVAPCNAEKKIKLMSHYITDRCGGDGAIRDLANILVEARGYNPEELQLR